jgi:hypothetical protein
MSELSTEQLERMLTSIIANSGTVSTIGVFPADRVPLEMCVDADGTRTLHSRVDNVQLSKTMHYCFILNTHTHDKPGEHWLAFFYNCNTNMLEYFDSFGLELGAYASVHSSLDECNLLTLTTTVNTSGMLQSPYSTVCGQYCMMYLYWRSRHYNIQPTHFSRNVMLQSSTPTLRDKYIVQQLRNILIQRACQYDALVRGVHSQTCICYHI